MLDIENSINRSDSDLFLSMLSSFIVVDICQIVAYNKETNLATIQLQVMRDSGNVETWPNVEVVFAGTRNGGLGGDPTNSAGLLFVPRTSVLNLRGFLLGNTSARYDRGTAKVLPLYMNTTEGPTVGFQPDGSFGIKADAYTLMSNLLTFSLLNASRNVRFAFSEEGVKISQGPEIDTLFDTTGSVIRTIKDKVTITSGSDGSVSVVQAEGASISIDASGAVSITTTGEIGVETEGAVTVKSAEQVTVNSASTVIKTDDGSGTLEMAQTAMASPSGQGPFCGIPYCAFSGAPQAGYQVSGV